GGGVVCFSSALTSTIFNTSPFSTLGNSTSSPRASGSALSQPSKSTREPLAVKDGTDLSFVSVSILVRNTLASAICDDTARAQISSYNFFCSGVVPTDILATLVGRTASCASWAFLDLAV